MQIQPNFDEDKNKKDIAWFNKQGWISDKDDDGENLGDEQEGTEDQKKYPINVVQCGDIPKLGEVLPEKPKISGYIILQLGADSLVIGGVLSTCA